MFAIRDFSSAQTTFWEKSIIFSLVRGKWKVSPFDILTKVSPKPTDATMVKARSYLNNSRKVSFSQVSAKFEKKELIPRLSVWQSHMESAISPFGKEQFRPQEMCQTLHISHFRSLPPISLSFAVL